MDTFLHTIKKYIPEPVFKALAPSYHYALAWVGAVRYGFPSRKIFIVAVTGTKGKTTTAELIFAMLEAAGHITALSGTLHFKIHTDIQKNMFKMTTPGRFFLQKFLREAVAAGCTHAILEMSSESVLQYRHKFLAFDALIFTNLAPEHIEAHGSYENYKAAKIALAESVAHSSKKTKIIVSNMDDKEGEHFFVAGARHIPYRLRDAKPYLIHEDGILLTIDSVKMFARLHGLFNLYNIVAAATFARTLGITARTIRRAIESFEPVPGRMHYIDAGQKFKIIVDYAHTPDSLQAVYNAAGRAKKICVLGSAGGGRDTWKRPKMGAVAAKECDEIILTDEDPYDEEPKKIVADVRSGMGDKDVMIEMNRRAAIAEAFRRAYRGEPGTCVLITGKGTDPYIMGPNGSKTPWSDLKVAQEEMEKLLRAYHGEQTA